MAGLPTSPLFSYSRGDVARWLGWLIVILIPLPLVVIAVLNVAYSSGDMMDLGWLSSVAWHNDWYLTGPPASSGESFFLHHISPIFWLTGLVSYVQPFGRLDYYAALLAGIYALYATGVYRAWQMGGGGNPLGGAVLAVLATFGAVGMQSLRLPHYEMAIPALALWFLLAFAERHYLWATIWFALCLSVREDAGFHLFGLLLLWAMTLKITHRAMPAKIWGFAAAALTYSVLALLIQNAFFPGADKFAHIYMGDPPWRHVTVDLLKDRFGFFLTARTYITIPLLLSLLWAWLTRNPLLPLGYIAFLPWALLNLLAIQTTAGALNFYYVFPFWLALAWPLLALHLWPGQKQPVRRWPWLLLVLFSLIGWQKDGVIVYPLAKNEFDTHPFALTEAIRKRASTQAFVDYFAAHKDIFQGRVDMPVFSLLIDSNDRLNWLATGHRYMSDPPPEAPPLPDIVIYFDQGFEQPLWVDPVLKTGAYHYFYQVPGSKIRLASQKSLEDFPAPQPFTLIAKPAL